MIPLPILGAALPAELAFNLLSRMTVKHLGVCARVCKSWKTYAYNDQLWKYNGVLEADSRADFLEKMQKVYAFSRMMFEDRKNPLYFDSLPGGRIICQHQLNFGYDDTVRIGECAVTPHVIVDRIARETPIKDVSALVNYLAACFFYFSEEEINTTLKKYHEKRPESLKEKRQLLVWGLNFFPKHYTDGLENVKQRVDPTITSDLLSLLEGGQISIKDKTIRLTKETRTHNVASFRINRQMQCTVFNLDRTNWPQGQKDLFPVFLAYCSRYTFKYGHLSLHQYCWEALKAAANFNEGLKILTATPKWV